MSRQYSVHSLVAQIRIKISEYKVDVNLPLINERISLGNFEILNRQLKVPFAGFTRLRAWKVGIPLRIDKQMKFRPGHGQFEQVQSLLEQTAER